MKVRVLTPSMVYKRQDLAARSSTAVLRFKDD